MDVTQNLLSPILCRNLGPNLNLDLSLDLSMGRAQWEIKQDTLP